MWKISVYLEVKVLLVYGDDDWETHSELALIPVSYGQTPQR